jgi:hypothetical protein
MKLKLPKRFYLDHRARECGESGLVVSSTNNYIIVELDTVALDDLLSDAIYYASLQNEDYRENRGVCLSARATVKAINDQLTKEV